MDLLFKALAKNHKHYISDGAVDAEFYVIAPDFMSALVKADEVIMGLHSKLKGHRSTDGLRLRKLEEVGEVTENVIMDREPEIETWIERKAREAEEQSGQAST